MSLFAKERVKKFTKLCSVGVTWMQELVQFPLQSLSSVTTYNWRVQFSEPNCEFGETEPIVNSPVLTMT